MIRALAGLMMIICGGLLPSAIILPKLANPPSIIGLSTTWQVSGLLLCALVCGPRPAVIAAFAYLTIGLFYLPIFHGGGSVGYILSPSFGYLLSFIPVGCVTGYLAQRKKNHFLRLCFSSIIGLLTLQIVGTISIVIGKTLGIWHESLLHLIYMYTLAPFPSQLALSIAVALCAFLMRIFLFI